jgi:hypothetical protein
MVADWTHMESINADGDNSDLFGVDLFSDELMDIYNSTEDRNDSSEHHVSLSSDIPQILDHDDGDDTTKNLNDNMGYSEIAELKSSQYMSDFTSILDGGATPTKQVDSMFSKPTNNNSVPTPSDPPSNGKKRTSESQQSSPKKKANTKTAARGNAAAVGRRTASTGTNNGQKAMVKNNTMKVKNQPISSDPVTLDGQHANVQNVSVAVQQSKIQPVGQDTASAQDKVKTPRLVPASANPPVAVTVVSSKTSVASSTKTEDSFKGVAQAAVNNLIVSAGQSASRFDSVKNESNTNFAKPVDTSTAHVAALTSNNWVAACAASISDAPPGTAEAAQAAALAAASDPAAAKAARARRASLTADERARQNRDRNREHARNTRLRKKAYVEELKRTLTELVTARDAAELERRHEKQRDLEVREVRYRVMEEFLKLRARGSEANLLARWVAILEDGFTLTIPRTDYRGMVHAQSNQMVRQVSNGTSQITDPTVQILRGATECFDDASKIAGFLQSLSNGNIMQTYNCDRKNFMMDGINAMLEWTLTATSAEDASPIICLKGCMRATFSPASNKLACSELLFDSGSVVNQVKSLVSYQDDIMADALLDSVLPQAEPAQATKQEGTLPCSVSVVSADKGETSSDDEGLNHHQQRQISNVQQEQN